MHNTHICTYPDTYMAQVVKNLPAIQETQVQILGQEAPLEEEMATHCSMLAWKIPWTEEPGRLQSMRSQRIRHDWAHMHLCVHAHVYTHVHAIIYTHTFVHKPRYKLVRGHSPQKQFPEIGKSQDLICFGICYSHVEISLSKGKHKDSWVTEQTASCPSWISSVESMRDESLPDT